MWCRGGASGCEGVDAAGMGCVEGALELACGVVSCALGSGAGGVAGALRSGAGSDCRAFGMAARCGGARRWMTTGTRYGSGGFCCGVEAGPMVFMDLKGKTDSSKVTCKDVMTRLEAGL